MFEVKMKVPVPVTFEEKSFTLPEANLFSEEMKELFKKAQAAGPQAAFQLGEQIYKAINLAGTSIPYWTWAGLGYQFQAERAKLSPPGADASVND